MLKMIRSIELTLIALVACLLCCACQDLGDLASDEHQPQAASSGLSHGLVAHWTFEDRLGNALLDVSGNARHGTVHGGRFVTSPNGQAMQLSSRADHVTLPDINNPVLFGGAAGAMTVSALVQVDNPRRANIICHGCGPMGFWTYGTKDSPRMTAKLIDGVSGANVVGYSPMVLRARRWTQLTFVLQGHQGYAVYVDGDLLTRIKNPKLKLHDRGVSIIGRQPGQHGDFVGQIDDLRIWNRALTTAEVASLSRQVAQCGNGVCSAKESRSSCPEDCLVLGCAHSARSRCVNLGRATTGWVTPAAHRGPPQVDGATRYNSISDSITIGLPAFNAGPDGLPRSPMVLEVRYKDQRHDSVGDWWATRSTNKLHVTSLIGFNEVDPDVMGLRAHGSGKWRVQHALFPRTHWQRVKVTSGYYRFKLNFPTKAGKALPIDYIALHAVTAAELETLARLQREARLFRRVERPAAAAVSGRSWFTKPVSEPVFESTRPAPAEVRRALVRRAARGERLTLSFSVLSDAAIPNVTLHAERLSRGKQQLPGLKVYRVVQDLKSWTPESLWATHSQLKTYGRMPDRIERFKVTRVKAQTATRFWFTLAVPAGATPGTYTGRVALRSGGATLFHVPVSVTVMPFALEPYPRSIFLYAEPHIRPYSNDPKKVLDNMQQHLVPPYSAVGMDQPVAVTRCPLSAGGPFCYDLSAFAAELDELKRRGMLPRTHFVTLAYKTATDLLRLLGISSGTTYERLSDPRFVSAYSGYIGELRQLAAARGVELAFSVVDEPNADIFRRTLTDRLYRVIRKAGHKTWVAFSPLADTPLCFPTKGNTHVPRGTCLPALSPLLTHKLYNPKYITAGNITASGKSFGYYTTGYSQLRNPVYSRFFVGHFAQRTGASAVGVYAYGHYVGDPYNDFDDSWHHVGSFHYPDFLLAYPSHSGEMISTMAYEGLREGVLDGRYQATLEQMISDKRCHPQASQARIYLTTRLAKLPLNWEDNYVKRAGAQGFDQTILKLLAPTGTKPGHAVFDQLRARVTWHLLRLNALPPCL